MVDPHALREALLNREVSPIALSARDYVMWLLKSCVGEPGRNAHSERTLIFGARCSASSIRRRRHTLFA